jgi:hypothetical protein
MLMGDLSKGFAVRIKQKPTALRMATAEAGSDPATS